MANKVKRWTQRLSAAQYAKGLRAIAPRMNDLQRAYFSLSITLRIAPRTPPRSLAWQRFQADIRR